MPPLPPPDGPNTPANGMSFSTPVVTGTAVLAKKKILSDRVDHFCEMPLHPDPCPTPAMIKAAILSTTETNSGGHNWCRGLEFTIQVVAGAINQNAVPGRDGNAPNQDWALYVYNAIQN